MARNRMIKTDFWEDEKITAVSRDARLTFIAMWNFSDDKGVVRGKAIWLKNRVYPYDEDIPLNVFIDWLDELESIKVIIPFKSHCENYFYIVNFLKHQKINRPSTWSNPPPPEELTIFT